MERDPTTGRFLSGNSTNRGRVASAEYRASMSAALMGHAVSDATRAAISAAKKGRPGYRRPTHGMHGTPEYSAWDSAKTRCYNPNANNYRQYGALGVRMCAEWLDDFAAFYAYIGPRPSPQHSLDRIDPFGWYEIGNVRFATPSEQRRNQRHNLNREMHVTGPGLINAIRFGLGRGAGRGVRFLPLARPSTPPPPRTSATSSRPSREPRSTPQ
jgi:hypothetical protein